MNSRVRTSSARRDSASPAGVAVKTADEAAAAFDQLGGKLAVVKAQIHAGGRGKGTIKDNERNAASQLVKTPTKTRQRVAEALLGKRTGHDPNRPRREDWSSRCSSKKAATSIAEFYLGIVVDRALRPAGADGLQRRRHEHRRGRRGDARADLHGATSTPPTACSRIQVRKLCHEARHHRRQRSLGREVHEGRSASCSSTSIAAWSKSTRWSSPRRAT